jgi:hypothetical protein
MSKYGRTYSDPSYGEKKVFSFTRCSMGTRTAAIVSEAGNLTVMFPSVVTDWNIISDATMTGTSTWVLAKGTVGLGTLTLTTDATAGATIEGSITATNLDEGDILRLYSGAQDADAAPHVIARVEYRERFTIDDN